ncbi:hypothetical protein ASPWEDRAFT_471924 [Aspergillus wentii DTO 134E9]|uniref:Nucleoside phosphorylase domain-containing protein n=1 Tax=Aspergillus wentii DTO 134E9 TaxID=1073089 RepID=A0A1L9RSJ9_ASPWE|nr:uncharacterized protein ASPWEDRAFT_471924 [Aspergillus wentii DTO 134E9]OJJ37902.1 hypothetical protein ASPWEDRAFT_471924 [Aspergillus wentii DTO 134E9]
MGPRKLNYDAYTVGWVCVQDCELDAVRALLDEEDEPLEAALNDDNLYILGRIGEHDVAIAFAYLSGTYAAAQVVTNLVRTFPNIRFGLMVGVGGGAPNAPHPDDPARSRDIRLGDVVVSEPHGNHGGVLNYDKGKWNGEKELSIESHLNSPPTVLLKGIRRLRVDHRFRKDTMRSNIQAATQRDV